MHRSVLTLVAALAALLLAAPIASARAPRPEPLPLGSPGLSETRSTRTVAPGVTYTRIVRGERDRRDVWTVDVAFVATRAQAEDVDRRLERQGVKARVERVDERAPDDPASGPLGYRVRSGSFATEAEANALRDRLRAGGFTDARTVFTAEDGERTRGPFVVSVLEVAPGLTRPELATEIVPGRELLTALARREAATASLNGGYFVIGAANGTDGDLAGISVLGGDLVSEAVDGRTSLVVPPFGRASVAALSDALSVRSSDGSRRELDGLNRTPGLIRGCGGSGGDQPTERPKHDFTCTDASELIRFDPVFGAQTEPGPGAEAVLAADGTVTALREPRGGPIPPGGSVLAATGDAVAWLRAHAAPGRKLSFTESVAGAPLAGAAVVNGGPRLLRSGVPAITAFAEGFVYREDPGFYYRFGVRRNPRSLAGVQPDGDLLLVAVDGRAPGYSAGASFEEGAGIMRALGARDAVNLDGGGSTGMTVGGALVTRPSDATGERPIGDALVVGTAG